MKMTKKYLIPVLAAVLALAVCFGCSTDAGEFRYDSDITVISRESGSGTRGAFIELFGVEEKDADGNKVDNTTVEAQETNNTAVMITTVSGNEYAIGYISLGSINNTVKAVKIDGVDATVENIKNGTYAVARPFNIAVKGDLSEVAQDFVNFIKSEQGQAVIEENGYIKSDGAPAFSGNQPAGNIVVAGSSSVTPVMEKLKEAYIAANPNAKIDIQQSDSSAGMNSTIEGLCDIGMASRELKDSEKEAGLKSEVIAMDGIAVIVNKSNPISDFTSGQIKAIFTGASTSWADFE